jgi:hypothetical protein
METEFEKLWDTYLKDTPVEISGTTGKKLALFFWFKALDRVVNSRMDTATELNGCSRLLRG